MNLEAHSGCQSSPEAELVLACARAAVRGQSDERIAEIVATGPVWATVIELARRNGLLPQIHDQLAATDWTSVPQDVRSRIQSQFHANAARNLATVAELVEVLQACTRDAIPLIPFKGVVLSQRLYGNFVSRVSNDFDLLVREQDAWTVRERLLARGYRPRYELPFGYEQKLLRADQQITLVHQRLPLAAEIHTALFIGPQARETTWEALEHSCESLEFAGTTIRVLPADMLLLYLCAHGAKHCWDRLSWVVDVAKLVRDHRELDWERLQARARQLHWERALLLGLSLARDLIGVPIPESIDLQQSAVAWLAREVDSRVLAPRVPGSDGGEFAGLRFQLICTDRFRDRIRLAGRVLLRPAVADWQAVPLPVPLSLLYYLIRPLRLMGKYGKRVLGERRA